METALAEVLLFLEVIAAETSLQSAVPVALRKRPAERTKFDNISIDMLDETIAEKIGAGDPAVVARAVFQAEAAKLAVEAMIHTFRSRSAEQAEAWASALKAQEAATSSLQAGEGEVVKLRGAE